MIALQFWALHGAFFGRFGRPHPRAGKADPDDADACRQARPRQSAVGTAVADAGQVADCARPVPGVLVGGIVAGAAAARPRHRALPVCRPCRRRCVAAVWVRWPSVRDGLRRLDRGSGETHRPATAIADEIAANSSDPVAQALWRAHVERALLSARKFKAGWPQPEGRDARSDGAACAGADPGGGDLFCRRRRPRQARHRRVRLARRGGAGQFPRRCLGDAAGLYRPARR